eukprot:4843554-Amphidinium_carterae.1
MPSARQQSAALRIVITESTTIGPPKHCPKQANKDLGVVSSVYPADSASRIGVLSVTACLPLRLLCLCLSVTKETRRSSDSSIDLVNDHSVAHLEGHLKKALGRAQEAHTVAQLEIHKRRVVALEVQEAKHQEVTPPALEAETKVREGKLEARERGLEEALEVAKLKLQLEERAAKNREGGHRREAHSTKKTTSRRPLEEAGKLHIGGLFPHERAPTDNARKIPTPPESKSASQSSENRWAPGAAQGGASRRVYWYAPTGPRARPKRMLRTLACTLTAVCH